MWTTNIKTAEGKRGKPEPVSIQVGDDVTIFAERRGDTVYISVKAPPEMPIRKDKA